MPMAVSLLICLYLQSKINKTGESGLQSMGYNALLLLAYYVYSWRKINDVTDHLTLDISPDAILIEQVGKFPITTPTGDIVKIIRHKDGAYTICCRQKRNNVLVFPDMADPSALEQAFNAIAPIENESTKKRVVNISLTVLAVILGLWMGLLNGIPDINGLLAVVSYESVVLFVVLVLNNRYTGKTLKIILQVLSAIVLVLFTFIVPVIALRNNHII